MEVTAGGQEKSPPLELIPDKRPPRERCWSCPSPSTPSGEERCVKSSREQMEIVNAYELVGSYRGAAELCGTTHKTVKRVIERREVGQAERRVVAGNTTGVQALITDRVRTSDGRISAKRLLPIVRAAGYTGSARNLRRAVADAKGAGKREGRTYHPQGTHTR